MRTDPAIQDPDAFHARWLEAHEGLTEQQSFELNARLVLLLANQVGDFDLLSACIDAAAKPWKDGAAGAGAAGALDAPGAPRGR